MSNTQKMVPDNLALSGSWQLPVTNWVRRLNQVTQRAVKVATLRWSDVVVF